jgi:hypothetical protein
MEMKHAYGWMDAHDLSIMYLFHALCAKNMKNLIYSQASSLMFRCVHIRSFKTVQKSNRSLTHSLPLDMWVMQLLLQVLMMHMWLNVVSVALPVWTG